MGASNMEKQVIQNQIAIFNLLSAIAEKLTGQTPNIDIKQEDNATIKITPDTSSVTWTEVE